MIDLQNGSHRPTPDEIGAFVRNPAFHAFCAGIAAEYQTDGKAEFSKCSLAPGWNIKFRKAGKSLCTVYPNETYFTVLVVVGTKEKDAVEALLPDCSPEIRELYRNTKEANGQKWLMIDVKDCGAVYEDTLRLIAVRRKSK